MKRIFLALALLAAGIASARAQTCGPSNPNCVVPTAPTGTSNNQAASTAFVHTAISNLPGGSTNQVQINAGGGTFGGLTNAQLTALINPATSSLSGALPAWPNNTTTYFRGDGTYVTLNCSALSGVAASCSTDATNANNISSGTLAVARGGTGVATTAAEQAQLVIGSLYAVATGVNFNSANTDTAITIALPTGFTNYRLTAVIISGASASLTTATFGVFTATGGGGTAIVNAATAITVSTAAANTNNNMQSVAVNNSVTASYNAGTLFFRVGAAQGSAATATVTLILNPVS